MKYDDRREGFSRNSGNMKGAARRTYPTSRDEGENRPSRGSRYENIPAARKSEQPAKPYGGNKAYGGNKPYGGTRSEGDDRFHGRRSAGPRVGAIYQNVPSAQNVGAPVQPVVEESIPAEENENLLVGRNPIREALKAGRPVEKLLVAQGDLSGAARDIIRLAKENGAVVQTVDRTRLDQIYPAHQGMLAYVAAVDYKSLEDIFEFAAEKGEDPFIIILDGITDPHNLGAIIRSAECAGAHGVIVPERRAAGLGPAAAKAAAGALNHMRIARVKNLNRTIDELKEKGVWVIGTAMDGENAFTADLTGPVALVIGSEGEGISRLTLEKCDRTLTLPMKGEIVSLNASVAAGILMYEIVRARAK